MSASPAVELLQPVLASGDAGLRRLAIAALGQLGGERARALVAAVQGKPATSATDLAFARQALLAIEAPVAAAPAATASSR